jgi:hypothetical protein
MSKKLEKFHAILRNTNVPQHARYGDLQSFEKWQEFVDEIYYEFVSPEEWHPYINKRPN